MQRECFEWLASLLCHQCLCSVSTTNSAFRRATFVKSFKISWRSVFNTSSLLMDGGRQGSAVLWRSLAACPLRRLSLSTARSSVPSHGPARTVPASRSLLLFQSVSFWMLNRPAFLHRNLCASAGEPAVPWGWGSAWADFPRPLPRPTFSPAIGLHCYSPPIGSVLFYGLPCPAADSAWIRSQ